MLDACAKHDVAFIPYFPLASGVLSGKYKRGAAPPAGTRLAGMPAERQEQALSDAVMNRVEALDAWAQAHGSHAARARVRVAVGATGRRERDRGRDEAGAGRGERGRRRTGAHRRRSRRDRRRHRRREGSVSVELDELSRAQLAVLGREWLLHGHLQDRVGMPLVHTGRTREEMQQIAIEEWMAASPIYSRRTQRALNFGERRRADDPQEHPARHRRAAPLHGLPLPRRRRQPRRVLARALRRAARRRADGRGVRARHVPRDRGPDLRRDRGRDEPARPGAAAAPAAARARRPRAALPLDDHDRSRRSRRSRRIRTSRSSSSRRSRRSPIEEPAADGTTPSPAAGTTTRATSIPTSSSRTSRTARS